MLLRSRRLGPKPLELIRDRKHIIRRDEMWLSSVIFKFKSPLGTLCRRFSTDAVHNMGSSILNRLPEALIGKDLSTYRANVRVFLLEKTFYDISQL